MTETIPNISCKNCKAACCKGPLLMSLTPKEVKFMEKGGTGLQVVAKPVNYDRTDVIYPVSFTINQQRRTIQWLAEKGNEYEPLAAGLGRYMMFGACGYLRTDENGWEYCSAYDQRPEVCQTFEEASEKCVTIRSMQGVPLPE